MTLNLSLPVLLWTGASGYGLAIGIPTLYKYRRRRAAARFFLAHPEEADRVGVPRVEPQGPRMVVARALVWSELVRIAIQAITFGIGITSMVASNSPKLARVTGDLIESGLIAIPILLDLQSHAARWMAARLDSGMTAERSTSMKALFTKVLTFARTYPALVYGAVTIIVGFLAQHQIHVSETVLGYVYAGLAALGVVYVHTQVSPNIKTGLPNGLRSSGPPAMGQ